MADKVVAVPGLGNVAFPDTMSDDDISSQIRKNASPSNPTPAPAQTQPEGGAASRFFGNLWDKTKDGAVGTAKVLYDLATNPTPHDLSGSAGQFITHTVNAHIEQGRQAKEALDRGHYSEAASHIMAAALPILGPMANDVGAQIGGTDAKYDRYGAVVQPGKAPDIAGGLGSATALLAPMAVGPAIGKVAGKLDSAADATAQSLTKSALKGGYTTAAPADEINTAVSTMRAQRAVLSDAGRAKINDALENLRKTITTKTSDAAANGVTVDPNAVVQRLDQERGRYQEQVNSPSDLDEFDTVRKNFLNDHTVTTPGSPGRPPVVGMTGQPLSPGTPGTPPVTRAIPIPADQAQAIKVGSNALNSDKYGKVSTARVEAEKALTRGLKEELETQIPELGSLNASQAKLMSLDKLLTQAVNKYANSDGFTGSLNQSGIAATALKKIIGNPALKARLAAMIDVSRSSNPGKFAAPAGGGLTAVNNLIGSLDQKQAPQQQPDQQQ